MPSTEAQRREASARTRKAVALAMVLKDHGATPEQAASLSAEQWATVATLAGTRQPSPATQAVAVELLRKVPNSDADPFAGLPQPHPRAVAFKARLAEVSTSTCPKCGGPTTSGMIASLGQCSACRLAEYAR